MHSFTFVKKFDIGVPACNRVGILNGNKANVKAGERTRRQVLEAALQVIDKEGVDAVTHRRVGQEAGLSHGVVGYHFPTRDALIHKAFETHLGSFQDYGAKIGWAPTKNMTRAQVVDVLARVVKEEIMERSSLRLDLELALYGARNPEFADLLTGWVQEGVDRLAGDLKYSGYKQSDVLARALTDLVRGFLLDCLSDPTLTEKDFRQRANALLSAFS